MRAHRCAAVTIISPSAGYATSAVVNFNATVLEQNPDSGIVQITPSDQGPKNYTLINASGINKGSHI